MSHAVFPFFNSDIFLTVVMAKQKKYCATITESGFYKIEFHKRRSLKIQ